MKRPRYYVFFDEMNSIDIEVLDAYWSIESSGRFFYTIENIFDAFPLSEISELNNILEKSENIGFHKEVSICSICSEVITFQSRNDFYNKEDGCCRKCKYHEYDAKAEKLWSGLKEKILSKNIKEKFNSLPYYLKMIVYGYLASLYKSGPQSFNSLNYKFCGPRDFDDRVLFQLVMEGVMYKSEGESLFDVSKKEFFIISNRLSSVLNGREKEDYLSVLNMYETSGFISCYSFYDNYENLSSDLLYMEENIRRQILKKDDIYDLKNFILDLLADRCITLCFLEKNNSNVPFSDDAEIVSTFKEILLKYSVCQTFNFIYYSFKNVASFLYNNDVNYFSQSYLVGSFIKNSYQRSISNEIKVKPFKLRGHDFKTVLEKMICSYVFKGNIEDINNVCVDDMIKEWIHVQNK